MEGKGTSNFAAAGVLLFDADGPGVHENVVDGNSDVGVFYIRTNGDVAPGTIRNNKVFDRGPDHPNSSFDVGIWNFPADDATVINNKVRGFDDPYVGVDGGGNKTVGESQPGNPAF